MTESVESAKVSQWRQRIERFERSNLTVVEFCRRERVSTPSFYLWRRRLERSSVEADGGGVDGNRFASVRVIGSTSVSVQLPGGTRVEIPAAQLQALEVVLEALARIDAQRAGGSAC